MQVIHNPEPGGYIHTEVDGVGQIVEVKGEPAKIVVARFGTGDLKQVSLDLSSLRILDPAGFLVYVATDRNKVRQQIKEQPEQVIKMLLCDSLTGSLDTADFKASLVPAWIPDEAWNKWWTNTQKKLKHDPDFDTSYARKQRYALRTTEQHRKDELISRLGFGSATEVERLGYLRELLDLKESVRLTPDQLELIRRELDWLARNRKADSAIRIQALLLTKDQEWISDQGLLERLRPFVDMDIRWRPVTRLSHFQVAQEAIMSLVRKDVEPPTSIWTGLLAKPSLAAWLLRRLLTDFDTLSTTGALSKAIEAAYPPRGEPSQAERDWIQDLLDVVEEVRSDWTEFDQASVLGWDILADKLIERVIALSPDDLTKKGVATSGIRMIATAVRWKQPQTESRDLARWLAATFLEAGQPAYVMQLVVEALFEIDDAVLIDKFWQQASDAGDQIVVSLFRLGMRTPSGEDVSTRMDLLALCAAHCLPEIGDYPRLADAMLEEVVPLVQTVEPRQLSNLLAIVQQAGSASEAHRGQSVRLQKIIWPRILELAEKSDLSPATTPVVLNEAFVQIFSETLAQSRADSEAKLSDARLALQSSSQELDELKQELAETERKRAEAFRSLSQSQAIQRSELGPSTLLVNLATALAEVERVSTKQNLRPEATAQLLQARLTRILRQERLQPIGRIGQLTNFDPKRHEIVEGKLGPDQQVEVIEIGYEQGNDQDRMHVKNALVRATGV